MGNVQVNYLSRDFNSIRNELINYLQSFYPEQWQDFNVTSPGMALLELNAYVGDILSYATDKKFVELFIDGVQERVSVYRLAKTKGYKVPGVRPAVSLVDIIIDVPATVNGPDPNYLPIYRTGMQSRGAGQIFETLYDIDFSVDFSEEGVANRTIQPVLNANQDLLKYRIVKREKVKAGVTKIYKQEVTTDGGVPFFTIELPEKNVLEILSVIVYNQIGLNTTPSYSDWHDDTKKYYEVDYLPTGKIFVENDSFQSSNGIKTGYWKEVPKRFEKEFLADGTCKLTFGGGDENYDAYENYISKLSTKYPYSNNINLNVSDILDNTALGNKIQKNSTIYVQYRVGGGTFSNVGSNVLTEVANIDFVVNGSNNTTAQQVIGSTRVNNPIPAIGGKGLPSVEEIKYNIAANHAAQERCVHINDYTSRAYQMPGKFGVPFRIYSEVDENKVKMFILGINSNGKLVSNSSSIIKNNIVEYLSKYKMLNDFVEVNDAKIINISTDINLLVDGNNFNSKEIKASAIDVITQFFDIEKWQMNQNIYISQIVDLLREVPGVINVVSIKFFNMQNGGYSSTIHPQSTGNQILISSTGGYKLEMIDIDNSILGSPLSMFEIKFPEKDIRIATSLGV